MSIRSERVGEEIKKVISETINNKVKDPRIGFTTVTDVEVTGDLEHAKVYLTVFGTKKDKEETFKALDKANGFIRNEIGKAVKLRVVPDLTFIYDESIDYGNKIERMIAEFNKKEK